MVNPLIESKMCYKCAECRCFAEQKNTSNLKLSIKQRRFVPEKGKKQRVSLCIIQQV